MLYCKQAFCDQLSVNTKAVRFWTTILLAQAETAY